MTKYKLNTQDKLTLLKKIRSNFWKEYTAVANDVIAGKYGNGAERIEKLEKAGYESKAVQLIVDYMLNKG